MAIWGSRGSGEGGGGGGAIDFGWRFWRYLMRGFMLGREDGELREKEEKEELR